MKQQPDTCDPGQIERCLNDSLSDEERLAFELHLEDCAACRQALETSAASAADWQCAREFLSSDIELPLNSTHGADGHSLSAGVDSDSAEALQREAVDGVLSVLAPTDDPRMLGRLGGYEIAGVIGRGGMGVVLKALDPALNRYVAIKVLAPQLATSGAARQRFSREARAAASVVHENVVAIHAVADAGPLPYFVMPYLRGSSLQKRLDARGPLGVAEILRVSIQIAAGLSAAHAQGLVHRDIKPANIMLEDGVERLKITDFGLARAADDASLTRTGVIAGTPQFMSPEQARGELIDSRSDLFSLGSVMYAMCTGRPPFRAETSYGTLQRICDAQPQAISQINAEIPAWLIAVIGELHQKNSDERFQTAQEVTHLLEQCLAHVRQPEIAPLPAAVRKLVANTTSLPPARRAAWHYQEFALHLRRAASFILPRKWLSSNWLSTSLSNRRGRIGAAAIFAAVVVTAVVVFRFWPSREIGPSAVPQSFDFANREEGPLGNQSGGNQSGAAGAAGVIVDAARAPWSDDGVAVQISQLQAEIDKLENRLSALKSLESPDGRASSAGNLPEDNSNTGVPQSAEPDRANPVPFTPVPPTQEAKP